MSQIPPPIGPLNYHQPYYAPPPVPTRFPALKFLGGMGAGTLISAIVWPVTFSSSSANGDALFYLIVAVLVVKLAAGITFLCLRPYRMLGGGILTSLALGFLIFFGVCANNLNVR